MADQEKGKLEEKAEKVQRHWFQTLPREKQAEIIRPAFEKEHSTTDKVREAVKRYENGC